PRARSQRAPVLRPHHRTSVGDDRPHALMFDSASRFLFQLLSRSNALKKAASRVGMRTPASFARRFVAGETVQEAIATARQLEAQGLTETFDHLGESVTGLGEADAARREYLDVIAAIMDAGVERNISLKLTQLGLDADRATAVDHLRSILGVAEPAGFF